MHRGPLVCTLGALALTSWGLAGAQNAFTARPLGVHAGPDREYPLVAQLDEGTPLDVHACLDDWSWCDVSFDDNRGWVYAEGVSFVYQGGRVPLYSYGPRLGLPIITFSLMTYWGDHYRGRPWYAQRDTWAHRRMPPHERPSGHPHSAPAPERSEHSSSMGHSGYRGGEEHGHSAPPADSRGGMASPSHGGSMSHGSHGRHNAPPSRPHESPPSMSQGSMSQGGDHGAPPTPPHGAPPSMSHGHSSGDGGQESRGAQHGHAAPPTRGGSGHGPGHGHDQRSEGHPPAGG